MELIEGAPLGEHFSSLKEKRQHFTEERLWRIFIQVHPGPPLKFSSRSQVPSCLRDAPWSVYTVGNQICLHSYFKLCLALRYLHKEKRIVHRDLTPNNIMLGDKDKVTVSKYKLLKCFNREISE